MNTSARELVLSVNSRWQEVEILIDLAESNSSNELLHNALCRSSVVLMVAHFEGFVKSCVKAVVEDANNFSTFADLPSPIKRTYCSKLVQAVDEKETKHLNQRVLRLIEIFDNASIEMEHSHFLVLNDFGNDKNNPKPELIEKVCANFGVLKFFQLINNSDLDLVFKDAKTEIEELNQNLVKHLDEGSLHYPYKLNSSLFNITKDNKNLSQKNSRTFWQEFLDEINRKRHAIAHGTSVDDHSSPQTIREDKNKLMILQYALILILCEIFIMCTEDAL